MVPNPRPDCRIPARRSLAWTGLLSAWTGLLNSRTAALGLCTALCAWSVACTSEPAPQSPWGLSLLFAPLSTATGCTPTLNGKGTLPTGDTDGVARLKVRWTVLDRADLPAADQAGEAAVAAADIASTGTWLLPNLPTSNRVSIEVFGCSGEAKSRVVWYGKSADLSVKEGEETTARIFMTQPGKASCTGTPGGASTLTTARAFSGGAALPSGQAVVVGGADAWDGKAASASVATDVYDNRLGRWTPGPALQAARISPTVVALGGTKLLVAGGHTRTLQINAKLPLTLFAPDLAAAPAVPAVPAELLDVGDATAGTQPSPVDLGAGALPLSRGVRAGDAVVFAGGFDLAGAPVAAGARVSGLAALAQGAAGTTQTLTLVTPRVQPALVAYADGTVVVWGGQTQKGAPLGELLGKTATTGVALQTSPDAVVTDPNVATIGPSATVVAESGDRLTFFVTGGSPVDAGWATGVPSYFVTVDRSTSPPTAVCRPALVGGKAFAGGIGVTVAPVGSTHLLVMGGLLALSKLKPESDPLGLCQTAAQTDNGCLAPGFLLLALPTDWSPATLSLTSVDMSSVAGFLPHFGTLALPLPVGVLTSGGMLAAVNLADAPSEVFDAGAQVVTPPFAQSVSDDVCKP